VVDLVEHLGHKYDQESLLSIFLHHLPMQGWYCTIFGRYTGNTDWRLFKRKKTHILHVHYWGHYDISWYRKVFNVAEKWDGILIENINTPVEPYIVDRVDHYAYVSEYAKNYATCVEAKSSVIYPGATWLFLTGSKLPSGWCNCMVYRLDHDKLKEMPSGYLFRSSSKDHKPGY